jgi:gamma-glutamyltranspeptidase / glutathione hydrolase
VLAPAIRAAERGFRVDKTYVGAAREAAAEFANDPKLVRQFAYMWVRHLRFGKVQVGDVIRMPELAMGLRLIAERGRAGFYDGPIAQATVEWARRDGGTLTREDLRGYTPVEVEPLRFEFAGRTFLTMPPPSSGGVAMAEALGIFERIAPADEWTTAPAGDDPARIFRIRVQREQYRASPAYVHALTESFKHAFADRSRWLGDPAFVELPVARLMSAEYHASLAARVEPARTLPHGQYGTAGLAEPVPDDHGTSHLSVVDRWGNAVACTETANLGYGSWRAVAEYGFLLNNEMDDFTTRRGGANAFGLRQSDLNLPAPGKRPLSSMTPTIVLGTDGRVEVVVGASGGPRIITGTTQAILNVLLLRALAGEAVCWRRLHHQWSPDTLRLEHDLFEMRPVDWSFLSTEERTALGYSQTSREDDQEPAVRAELTRRGHRVEPIESVGNVQLIRRRLDGPGWDAACDPRKGGRPAGH